MEIIEVTAHFDSEGRVTPITFVWNGISYRVEGTGRRWEAKDGLHILVMVSGDRAYHLIFDFGTGIWKLARSSEPPTGPKI
ncbi:hypothetical protein ACFLXI_04400 [Chloroflexota bacterium]